ncbi:MAG: Lrp/AsnC ligand binding domain-containing protein [Bacteroidales bacterium]|nr:Lrp/AsnC ligand binding domain-containing protein [Bacteroidales bacterium]
MQQQIDTIDQKILSCLVKNARMPYLEIARICGISGAAIHQRIKKLESNGIILGSRLLVKPEAIGLNICVFIAISLSNASHYEEVICALDKIPEIVECHFITGKFAFLVKVYCSDNEHLMNIILKSIHSIPNIVGTETFISLSQAIDRQVSPV